MQKLTTTSPNNLVRLSLGDLNSDQLVGNLLKQGEIVMAKVISSRVKGEVLLQLGDIQLKTLTQCVVKDGDIVNLKVIRGGQEPLLQIVPQPSLTHSQSARGEWVLKKDVIKLLSLISNFPKATDMRVEARVVTDSGRNGAVRLQFGQMEYEGISAKKLKRGQTIILRVLNGGREPQLQIVTITSAKSLPGETSPVRKSVHNQSQSSPIRLFPVLATHVSISSLVPVQFDTIFITFPASILSSIFFASTIGCGQVSP